MKQIILVLSCCLFMTACVNWDITGPAGPEGLPGPPGQKPPGADTSSILGRVFTFNQFTVPIWPVDSVKITLHLSADSTLETMADTAGYYRFNGISTGTYNLTYSRSGFGEMKVFGQTHISGGTLNTTVQEVSIVQIATQNLPDSAWFGQPISPDYISFRFTTTPSNFSMANQNYLVFFSKHANVSDRDYLFKMEYQSIYTQKSLLAPYFSPGDSMYARVYLFPRYFYTPVSSVTMIRPGTSYIDPSTGELVYPFRNSQSALAAGVF
ncbi:carboxypeptidase-like regulatory domain-containing protein [Chitinophaga filiformis]|uniref:carboxypeptidase-like regulatory domain-containing protein n=1 Tax=Chitinophaga filiformis TaxID=104663 RepID=UPI001F3138A8|nr:carboxypeptidase-like regulatory domain-containing protein [Chitinophaga filiformis]MCF6406577.1 carboxypeptidase-like regulatory domain-containing protein [Chitinophaga filiformis]